MSDYATYNFFEARYGAPRALNFLAGYETFNTTPKGLSTAPRDTRNGLPLDWAMTIERVFFACSVPMSGVLHLRVNGTDFLEWPLLAHDTTIQPALVRPVPVAGPSSKRARQPDKFTLELTDVQHFGDLASMEPIHKLAEQLKKEFLKNGEVPAATVLAQHFAEIDKLGKLPSGPWMVAGISGPTTIVIV